MKANCAMPELLDIVGQDNAVGQLQRGLGGPRRPHAYLFVGPTGVGRRTTAVALARTLLCHDVRSRPNAGRLAGLERDFPLHHACGVCPSCRTIDAGSHADFHMVYKELARYHDDADVRGRVMQDLGIDVIRQFLIAPAGRAAAGGRGKVFVVREAELMSVPAQNCLLKTLEEPPPGVRIILLCRDAEELLPTTLSRCWLVRFGPLPRAFVRDKLTEGGMDAAEADFWAAFTGGSIGRAATLAAAGMYPIKRDLLDRLAALNAAGSAELADWLVKVTDKLAEESVGRVKRDEGAALSKNLASRQSAGAVLEIIASAYRDAIALATGTGRPLVHADQPAAPAALAARMAPTQLAEVIEQLAQYEDLLWRNVSPKTVWDNVAITCNSAAPLRL
jgi:DNA polymerase III subunit delta'